MYNIINTQFETILNSLNNHRILQVHFELYLDVLNKREHILNDNNEINEELSSSYKRLWSMNVARLSKNDFYPLYYRLRNENNIYEIITALRNAEFKTQYSFSTKLYHTFVDQNFPIYDSKIKLFYLLPDPKPNSFHEQISFLQMEYQRIIQYDLLNNAIQIVRNEFNLGNEITTVKIIDSIIWIYVNTMQKRLDNNIDIFKYM